MQSGDGRAVVDGVKVKVCGDKGAGASALASRQVADLITDLKNKTRELRQAQEGRESEVERVLGELDRVKIQAAKETEALTKDLQEKTMEVEEERRRTAAGRREVRHAEDRADALSQQLEILELQARGMLDLGSMLREQVEREREIESERASERESEREREMCERDELASLPPSPKKAHGALMRWLE